jgi:hypothetical protein
VHYVKSRGIDVRRREMDLETPAVFDGLSITLNPRHDEESLAWYLVHSFGSIAGWCVDLAGTTRVFHELRDAKGTKAQDPARLERAIARFRAFEERASRYSVQVLADSGHADAIRPFSLFFRADLEAITQFHRDGRAPVWPEFLERFRAEVADGRRPLVPFAPLPIPPFQPTRIERQEVKQER